LARAGKDLFTAPTTPGSDSGCSHVWTVYEATILENLVAGRRVAKQPMKQDAECGIEYLDRSILQQVAESNKEESLSNPDRIR
jgi:hypothetical protein